MVVEIQGMVAECKRKHETNECVSYRTYHNITMKGSLRKVRPEKQHWHTQCKQGMAINGHTLGKLEAPCATYSYHA